MHRPWRYDKIGGILPFGEPEPQGTASSAPSRTSPDQTSDTGQHQLVDFMTRIMAPAIAHALLEVCSSTYDHGEK